MVLACKQCSMLTTFVRIWADGEGSKSVSDAVGDSPHCFSQINAVHCRPSIAAWLATGEASRRQNVDLWVSRPQPRDHLLPAPEGTAMVDQHGSIFSNRSAGSEAVFTKNRVHFISSEHERLFISNQCRRVVADVEYSICSHRSITLPTTGHDRSADSRHLECRARLVAAPRDRLAHLTPRREGENSKLGIYIELRRPMHLSDLCGCLQKSVGNSSDRTYPMANGVSETLMYIAM
jgi:hypothetical protein